MKKVLKYIFHLDHWLITLLAFSLLSALYALVTGLSIFDPVKSAMSNMSTTDLFFQITHKESDVNQDITIVNIEDEYNRGNIAKCIATVDSMKPWAIGVDISFDGIKGDPADSKLLMETAANMITPTVWAAKLSGFDSDSQEFNEIHNSFFVDSLGMNIGFVNLDDNLKKSIIRKMLTVERYDGKPVPSFAIAIALLMGDSVDVQQHSKPPIDFSSKFNVVCCSDLAKHRDLIKNHIVLIGTTTDDADVWNTPIGLISGVQLHAHSLDTLRNHTNICDVSAFVNLLITFLLCYMFEVLLDLGFQWLRRRDTAFGTFLIDSKLLLRVVTIIVLAIVTWAILLVFVYQSKYVNAVLILAALGLLVEARRIYNAAIKALSKNHEWWVLKNSLFNNNPFK